MNGSRAATLGARAWSFPFASRFAVFHGEGFRLISILILVSVPRVRSANLIGDWLRVKFDRHDAQAGDFSRTPIRPKERL